MKRITVIKPFVATSSVCWLQNSVLDTETSSVSVISNSLMIGAECFRNFGLLIRIFTALFTF